MCCYSKRLYRNYHTLVRRVLEACAELDGQLDGFVHPTLFGLVVVVEEVAVQPCLHDACYPDNPLQVVLLGHEPVQPVEQVEPAVSAEREHVVRSQVLYLHGRGAPR